MSSTARPAHANERPKKFSAANEEINERNPHAAAHLAKVEVELTSTTSICRHISGSAVRQRCCQRGSFPDRSEAIVIGFKA